MTPGMAEPMPCPVGRIAIQQSTIEIASNKQKISNDDEVESIASSTCSNDTGNAFLEMIGLLELDGISSMPDSGGADCPEDGKLISSTINERNSPTPTEKVAPSVRRLDVPQRCSRYLHEPSDVAAFVIDNCFGAEECQHLIHLADKLSRSGFQYVTEATHTDDDGVTHKVKLQEPNKHKLSVFEHPPTLDKLWHIMKPMILPHIQSFIENTQCGQALGLNPRMRVLRYDSSDNDVFEPHFDATTRVGSMTSLLTVLIYLNDGGGEHFDGGETCFMDSISPKRIDTATKITPVTGRVVLFEHDLYHSSAPPKLGTKYVLRTDVLFEVDIGGSGADKPRGNAETNPDGQAFTLLELCRQLRLPEEDKVALDEIGLLDLTLESLFAPGLSAVRQMLHDSMGGQSAEQLLKAAVKCKR
ncbi:hypothetical protein ACHAWF_003841 [Thalassiosira exigua]